MDFLSHGKSAYELGSAVETRLGTDGNDYLIFAFLW